MTRILIPSGALGLGYDETALQRGIAAKPDLIAIDGGSTDSGPSYLGRGVSKYSRSSTKREWQGLIAAREAADVPLVIGTAGTCGAGSAVDWMVEITEEILRETGRTARIAVLKSDQPKARIKAALAAGRVTPLDPAPEVTAEVIDQCTNIVALAGAEQIAAALDTGAELIIAGRTTDTAIISALPIMQQRHTGAAWHGAKIGECGALCATNPQSGVILLDVDETGFVVTPLADGAFATPHTVSAHMLYENTDPFVLYEPGGHLDVSGAKYSALDERRVRVEGSVWVPSDDYTVKLEASRSVGFQTILMALLRDPRIVENASSWCADIVDRCTARAVERLGIAADSFHIELRLIGHDATLGQLERRTGQPVELGVLALVTAPTQETAHEIGQLLNPFLLHHPLTRQEEQPTFAFPFSPAETDRGAAWEFCMNHLLHVDDPMEPFTLEVKEFAHA